MKTLKCPKCKKEIETPDDLEKVRAETCGRYIELRAECQCGQRFYTSLGVDDLTEE